MDPSNFIDPNLTEQDLLVLKNLLDDAEPAKPEEKDSALGARNRTKKRMPLGHVPRSIPKGPKDPRADLISYTKWGQPKFR